MSDIPMVKVNFHLENVISFSVELIDGIFEDNRVGVIVPALSWEVEKVSEVQGPMPRGGSGELGASSA
jgi:hypothetical protein